jgi:hypothetical protein
MPKGLWVWPPDARGQRATLKRVAGSPHLMAALSAIAKSKEGMSDSELAEALSDGSEWTTLWVIRQLTSLGFIEYKVDFFGNPARYQATDQGRMALSTITGQPLPRPAVPVAPPAPPVPKPAAPAPQAAAPKAT